MLKKSGLLAVICCVMIGSASLAIAGEGKIGGNLKFWLYDASEGTSKIDAASDAVPGAQRITAGLSGLYIFISRELTDKISVDVEPKISASTGATPKLGTLIGGQMKTASAVTGTDVSNGVSLTTGKVKEGTKTTLSLGFVRAQINAKLPYQYELSAGLLRPIFTEDYGAQLWYEEEFIGNYVSANSFLGSSDEAGIEIYKNYELGNVSLPAYLYLVNGAATYTDNNNGKGVMVHVAPEIGDFKFMGSYSTAKYDTDNKYDANRWSGGLGYEKGKFMFRSEYMGGVWEKYTSGQNFYPAGYYAKVAYRVYPWARALLSYSHYDYTGLGANDETYTDISPIINFYASPESIIYLQYMIVSNKLTDDSKKLEYNRLILGWRTTF